jgi:hypothetical protein
MRTGRLVAVLALALAPALTGCGGSSSSSSNGARTTAQQLPGELAAPSGSLDQSAPAGTTASKAASKAGADGTAAAGTAARKPKAAHLDPVSAKNHVVKARHRAKNEQRGTGVKPLNPCTLVTRSEAVAIVGHPIAALHQAPLGPTCIYQGRRAKSLVTMAVQSTSFTAPQAKAKNVTRVTLRGHKAYCVKRGNLMMLVPLAPGHVLNVTAPCPIAASFASKALARLYP